MKIHDPQYAILMAYVIGVPLIVIPGAGGAGDMLTPLALIVCLKFMSRRMSWPLVFLYAFIVTALVSSLISFMVAHLPVGASRGELLLAFRMAWIYLPLALALQYRSLNEGKVYRLFRAFLWSGGAACLIGLTLHALGIQMREEQQMNYYGGGIAATARAGGLLGNSGDFGHLSSILVATTLTCSLLFRRFDKLALVVLCLALVGIYASSSRAAILHVLVLGLMAMPLLLLRRRLFQWMVLAFLGLSIAAYIILPDLLADPRAYFIVRRFDFLNLTGETLFYNSSGRTENWARYIESIGSNPLLGVGYKMIPEVFSAPGDNSFLSILVETGIVPGLFYMLLWLSLLWTGIIGFSGRESWIAAGFILSEMAHMATVDTHGMWATTPLALLFAGLLLRLPSTRGNTAAAMMAVENAEDSPAASADDRPNEARSLTGRAPSYRSKPQTAL